MWHASHDVASPLHLKLNKNHNEVTHQPIILFYLIADDDEKPEDTELFPTMAQLKDRDGTLTPPLVACGFGHRFHTCCRYSSTSDSFQSYCRKCQLWNYLLTFSSHSLTLIACSHWCCCVKAASSLLQMQPVHWLSTLLMQNWELHLKVKKAHR